MELTLEIEEYGFMVFSEVFNGPRWAEYPENPSAEPKQPRGHVVEVTVDGSATLADVLNMAAASFGIALSKLASELHPGGTIADEIDGVAFYLPGDEASFIPKSRFVRRLPVVDSAGRLWIEDFRTATIEGLQRAETAGLIEGEILHPYLRPMVSAGAMGSAAGEWASIVDALRFLWRLLDDLAPLGTIPVVYWFGQPLLKRLSRAIKKVERKHDPVADRGVRPGELKTLLSRKRWLPGEVSQLLDMSDDDAADFLISLGFEQDEEGAWTAASNLAGELVSVAGDIATIPDVAYQPQVEARLRYAVDVALRTGRVPTLEEVFDETVWPVE